MKRRTLGIVVGGLALVGLVVFALMLGATWRPSESAGARLHATFDIPPPGGVRSVDSATSRIFVVHTVEGDIGVFRVPLVDGSVALPDIKWYRTFKACHDFGPDTPGGQFTRASVFACHDPQLPEWWAPRWRWGFDGHNLVRGIEDMPRVDFEVIDSRVRIGRTIS